MRPFFRTIFIFLAAAVCLGALTPGPVRAQNKLELLRADSLRNRVQHGETVKILSGDVRFKRGEYRLYSDHAIDYKNRDVGVFWGHVRIEGTQDSLFADSLVIYDTQNILDARGHARLRSGQRKLNARHIRYFSDKETAYALGDVRLEEQNGRYATADSIWYNSKTKQAEIFGKDGHNATVYDPDRQIQIRGPRVTQDLNTQELRAQSRPILSKQDSSGKEILRIIGNTLSGNPDSGRYVARDSVIITRDSLRAETNLATLFEEQNYALLEQSPVIYYTDNVIRGNTIQLFFRQDSLREVMIPDNADVRSTVRGFLKKPLSTLPDSVTSYRVVRDTSGETPIPYALTPVSQEDVLRGNQLRIWLEQNRIRRIRVTGMAQSTYHVFEDSIYQGINETSGDTISLQFAAQGDSLRQIDVIGGTRGNFQPHQYNTSVDTTIYYEADHITFQVPERMTHLQHEADTKYKDMELEAAFIDVDWNKNLLTASPLPDTSGAKTAKRNIPTFHQASKEPMTGRQLVYNLKTRQGTVTHGSTKDQDGFYVGQEIYQRGENTLFVDTGRYTTCDLDDPHFYFQSKRMKLIVGDLVVARPIIMYIHGVPVFALPFGVFPQKQTARSSGYILPTWGESATSGRYLRGMGFYWAPSDYWDYRILFDFWENRGISVRNRLRYNKRYRYSGNIDFSYDNELFRPNSKQNYQLSIRHSQTLDPTMDLQVNGRFVSSSQFIRETSIDRSARLQQQIISNATLSKRWENTKNSMSVNLQRTENLQSGNISQTLPQISFRRGTDRLFKPADNASFAVKNRWYYNINYSFGSNLSNALTHQMIADSSYTDAYGIYHQLGEDSVFVDQVQRKVSHDLTFSSPNRIFKYFNITPNLSISEDWVPQYREPVVQNGTVVVDSLGNRAVPRFRLINQFRARHTFRFSIGTSTKLYGLFNLPFKAVSAIRHVMTPSISYHIGPDFSRPGYGYYYYGTMPDGTTQKFDRFQGTAVGGTGARQTQSISLSLRNVFQAKYLSGSGEDQKENKIDFLTWNISTGYNFESPTRKWSTINSSIRANLGRTLAFDINMRHDPYKYQTDQLTIPRLTNLSLATGFTLSGNTFAPPSPAAGPGENTPAATDSLAADTTFGEDLTDPGMPGNNLLPGRTAFPSRTGDQFWSLRLNLAYSLNHPNPDLPADPTFWLNSSATVKLSKNWSLSMSTRLDMVQRSIVSNDFTIRRDLHCWELSFRWTPSGPGQGYYLRINVKSPALQDVKIEERGGRANRFGW